MRSVTQQRGEASTRRMIEATRALLAEGGLGAVTVAAVAERAGTSNGSLYHRFGDRQGLLLAVQDSLLAALENEAAAVMEQTASLEPAEAAEHAVAGALRLFTSYRPVLRAFFVEGQSVEAFAERNARCTHRLASRAERLLIERVGLSPTRAAAVYRVLFSVGAAQSLFTEQQMRGEPVAQDELAAVLIRLVLP
ncbi:TetR/AcrR family transcriptional regulator [uncultured Aeromicrobium sp.]|uniref:TetR/AcrR family transcriptional regulator n=1 Tax=uncultured Aeromicrobium sp. TaxID=337820 RepID=UPI0025D58D41|nr:TetR/AcrR family transcriptional regulator [uncultured Aeromicrobium sp.]